MTENIQDEVVCRRLTVLDGAGNLAASIHTTESSTTAFFTGPSRSTFQLNVGGERDLLQLHSTPGKCVLTIVAGGNGFKISASGGDILVPLKRIEVLVSSDKVEFYEDGKLIRSRPYPGFKVRGNPLGSEGSSATSQEDDDEHREHDPE